MIKFVSLIWLSTISYAYQDGLLCVSESLIDVFDTINQVRKDHKSSPVNLLLSMNSYMWQVNPENNNFWTTSDGTK